jgi:sortase A
MTGLAAVVAAIQIAAASLVAGPGREPAWAAVGRMRMGTPVATLAIPRLHFHGIGHQGTDARVLALGPGHYPSTALPGQPGTTAFAGHRVTHTHPFLHINDLRRGDTITVTTRWGRFRYRVYRERIVPVTDVSVLANVGFQQLILTACHPPHTALERYVVFARRVPMGAARRVREPATAQDGAHLSMRP